MLIMPELRRERPVNLWGLVVNQPNLMLPKEAGDPVSNKTKVDGA